MGAGEDRISGLPDELLHSILVRLGSASAAARTSVLARRWRGLWRHLPELIVTFGGRDAPDAIDAALAALSATAAPLERLYIFMSSRDGGRGVRASRAAPWLRFASEHVVGELRLFVPVPREVDGEEVDVDLELPWCPRAKTIRLSLPDSWRLRPQLPAGLFAALTSLKIGYCRMEASELTDLVSNHCPVLRDLDIFVVLVAASDVSVLSDSLQSLKFFVLNTQKLEVVAPRLEKLLVSRATKARISCPKLVEVVWNCSAYDARRHQFDDVGRHLQLLEIDLSLGTASLMRRFDEVDKLKLRISIPWGTAGYESFLNETNQLPKCRTLDISLLWSDHGITAAMLHLLRKCNSTRKVFLNLIDCHKEHYLCPSSCPCRSAESGRINGIALSFLEEVELDNFGSSNDELEFLEQLSKCNAAVLNKLVINYASRVATPLTKAICEKVRNMWCPNVNVQFYVFLDGRRVHFD